MIGRRGARGYFYKTAELLQKIRNTYNNSVEETEMGILTPIFDADVLVLDDVGLERPTEWVQETLGVLIDKRYSNQKPTILTGNLNDDSSGKDFVDSVQFRLGPRTRSRLLEMCRWSSSRATIRASWGFTPPTRKSGSGTSARNSSTDKCPTSRKGWPKRDFAQAATRSSNGPEGRAAREHAGSLPAHPVLRRDLQLLQLQPGPARRGTQDALRRRRLTREIETAAEPETVVDTIYFGGGTPSLLTGREVARVVGAVRDAFDVDGDSEITLEANPESVTAITRKYRAPV